MDKYEKEKLSRYGKLVWDFANAETTDDILISYFKNLRAAFDFSKDFPEKALIKFPTKQVAKGTLSSKEQNLFEILLERNDIWYSVNRYFSYSSLCLYDYNTINCMFKFQETEWRPCEEPDHIDKTFLIPENEMQAYIDNAAIDETKDVIKADLKKLAKLCHKIEEIKSDATDRFEELNKIAKDYNNILKIHHHIDETQKKLKRVLLQIIKAVNAYDTEGFKSMLLRYNKLQKTICVINNEHMLIEIGPFIEDTLIEIGLIINNSNIKYLPFDGKKLFNAPISYCLIEYLKHPEYKGKERIAVCQKCNCIFGKSKLNSHQIYCPACSRKNKMTPEERADYQKKYRANPARIKAIAKTKKEEIIKHLMANAGKTRREAEIIAEDEM